MKISVLWGGGLGAAILVAMAACGGDGDATTGDVGTGGAGGIPIDTGPPSSTQASTGSHTSTTSSAHTTSTGGQGGDGGAGNGGAGGSGGDATGGGGAGGENVGGSGGQGGVGGSGGAGGQGGSAGGGGNGGAGGGAQSCGGHISVPCPSDQYCDYGDNLCGAADGGGVCAKKPTGGCPLIFRPTCGCDGMVYGNSCEAAAAGQDENANGTCAAPTNTFVCGSTFCQHGTQYCQDTQSDIFGNPSTYTCEALPTACTVAGADCTCFTGTACADRCEKIGKDFALTCGR